MFEDLLDEKRDTNTGAIAIFVRDGKALFGLRNYKDPGPLWTNPGGRCDKGETIRETLTRETKEEVGITDFKVIDYLGELHSFYNEDDKVLVFICETNQEPKLKEPEKFEEWKWLKPEAVPENFINPPIIEMMKEYLKENVQV